jgi:hypothetical protein
MVARNEKPARKIARLLGIANPDNSIVERGRYIALCLKLKAGREIGAISFHRPDRPIPVRGGQTRRVYLYPPKEAMSYLRLPLVPLNQVEAAFTAVKSPPLGDSCSLLIFGAIFRVATGDPSATQREIA